MNPAILEWLRCPRSGRPLVLCESKETMGSIESGWLTTDDGVHRYPVRNFIPRFVPSSTYADSFGMQWNLFRRTQLDSHTGHPISAARFWEATGWTPSELADRLVLDVGCGAGRFAEIALNAGASVIALDYSAAVDACYANLKHHPRLHVVQGDVYDLPFSPATFSFVYSLGVMQHTPDVHRAVAALPPLLDADGKLCVDFYGKTWKSPLLPKYWLRPITKRVPKPILLRLLQIAVPAMLPLSNALGGIPGVGKQLRRIVPVANYRGELPLNEEQQREWTLLDTYDWFSPDYDNPQTAMTVREWLEQAGLQEIEVLVAGHLVGRGRATA